MITYDPEQPLISIHIPKCAGKSFRRVLKHWFGRRLYTHYAFEIFDIPPRKHRLTQGFFSKSPLPRSCVHGHFSFSTGTGPDLYYPDIKQYISIVRDPFEMKISNYFYVRKMAKFAFKKGKRHPIVAQNLSLEEHLNKNPGSYLLNCFPQNISLDNYKDVINEHYVYIGITEDLNTSVSILASKLGFEPIEVPVVNVSPRYEGIPSGAREKFIEENKLEWLIYQYVLENYKSGFQT
jgi:hypothetical protein